jgi:hypothetical protein
MDADFQGVFRDKEARRYVQRLVRNLGHSLDTQTLYRYASRYQAVDPLSLARSSRHPNFSKGPMEIPIKQVLDYPLGLNFLKTSVCKKV